MGYIYKMHEDTGAKIATQWVPKDRRRIVGSGLQDMQWLKIVAGLTQNGHLGVSILYGADTPTL